MKLRVAIAVALVARGAWAQSETPLSCNAIVPPSDSGAGRFGTVSEGPGGRLAWTDGRPGEFLLKDANGKVRTIGRSGGGPGEFQRVGQIGWLGDTVWVSDVRVPRVTFFSDTGRLISVVTATPQAGWVPRPDGRLVGMGWVPLGRPTPPPLVVVSQRPGELRRDTIKAFPNPPVERYNLPPSGTPAPQSFAFTATASHSPDGSRFCGVRPDGDDGRIECVDDRGRSLLDAPLRLTPRRLTDAVYDSVVAGLGRGQGRTEAVMRDLIKKPRNLPPVMWIMIDNDGGIWLQRSHRSEPVAVWTRLRPNGSIRDELVIPKRYRVVGTNGDAMWVATADADGVETLHRCQPRSR